MKKNLLIIQQHQFGYLTDSYKWCEYLRDKYNITVLCYDAKKEKMNLEGVHVKYIGIVKSRYLRGFLFLFICIWNILCKRGKVIVVYFKQCDYLKRILPFQRMLLDIRTLSVSSEEKIRTEYDQALIKSSRYFDYISVISEGIKNKIGDRNNIGILSLGADILSTKKKQYDYLRLLYIGTLTNRHIEKTIEGISIFHQNYPNIDFTYDIVGDGNSNELDELKLLVKKKNLSNYISFHGRVPYSHVSYYFDTCNIGVSFIPMTEYYDYQPPTKTYEYILAGLYTIATATLMNKTLISNRNGILIEDTPESFAQSIKTIYKKRNHLKEIEIRESLQEYTWKNIVTTQLIPILKNI